MDQQNQSFEEQAEQAREASRKLKRKMIIAIVCMVAFAIVAVILINLIESCEMGGSTSETQGPSAQVPSERPHGNFFEPDYEYDIMQDAEYLEYNRRIYHCDERSGLTEELTEKNMGNYGEAAAVLCDMINAVIAGNADAYNELFSDNYYAKHSPESPFTMQRLYDIKLTKVSESIVAGESGKYTQYEYEVEYKIHRNDGTFRTDIGQDESKKQYFILSDSTSEEVLIDQILNFNYK